MGNVSQEPDSAIAVISKALHWVSEGYEVALASVVNTWGSAPRQVGSIVAINNSGEFCGSVSGGCIETSVIQEAFEVMTDGAPRTLLFDVSDESAWSVGLACGGKITVRIDPISGPDSFWIDLYKSVTQFLNQHRSCFLMTDIACGRAELFDSEQSARGALQGLGPDTSLNKPGVYGSEGQEKFLNVFHPPSRLIVLGGVHIAQMLVSMAQLAGFEPIVVERRSAFAASSRFPGVQVLKERSDHAIWGLAPDAKTAVIALTHNPELDDPGLMAALASPAFYVGALGSQRTQKQRRIRLLECGVEAQTLDRLHAPIGLNIGASTPAEIAVSILAEIIAELRGKL